MNGPHYIESGCTDGILRPTLLCFSDGSCYRLVKETFGKRQQDEPEQADKVAEDTGNHRRGIVQRPRPSFQGSRIRSAVYITTRVNNKGERVSNTENEGGK